MKKRKEGRKGKRMGRKQEGRKKGTMGERKDSILDFKISSYLQVPWIPKKSLILLYNLQKKELEFSWNHTWR